MNYFNAFEAELLHKLKDAVSCSFLDTVMPLITALGNVGIFWIILASILLIFKKTRRAGAAMIISLILGLITCNLTLKPLAARIRPYDFDPSLVLLIPRKHDFSFPSGHTAASFESAVALFAYHRKAGTAAIVLASLIAFSRLYLTVHYPLDVICGLIIGIIMALLGICITNVIYRKIETK